jgi:hypothetical protein
MTEDNSIQPVRTCDMDREVESQYKKQIQKNNNAKSLGWNLKTISIKKRITTAKNNNQNNKDHIWYKNKMWRNEIQRQLN